MQGKNRIAVLHPHDSSIVTLDLSIEPPSSLSSSSATNTDKSVKTVVKSMAREEAETALKTLDRLRMLFAPPRPKGQASRKQTREELLAACPTVRVYCRASDVAGAAEEDATAIAAPGSTDVQLSLGENEDATSCRELNTALPNRVFWKLARVVVVGESTQVQVVYNVPTITAISHPGVPYVGLPLVCANVSLLFAEADKVCYEWCVVEDGAAGVTRVVGTEATFTPTADLAGRSLLLRVSLDTATGLWSELRLPEPVRQLPAPVARWQETATAVADPAFRVVTYNILYDDFCTSKSSKAKIYPFATDDILDLENRKVRIVQELLAYHPDLVCLQECGRDVFQTYLLPVLKAVGYDGVYMNKNGSVKEGCGFLFRQSRYELVNTASIPLNYATLCARHADLAEKVAACPEAKEALSVVTTIGAYVVLRDVARKEEVVVGNTHLFFHANACHIRILQTYMLLHWLHSAAAATTTPNGVHSEGSPAPPPQVRPVVLCGDFNATHPTGGYRLVTTGQVESGHHSWDKGGLFWWGCSRLLGYDAERLEELLGGETVLPQATVARKDFKRKKKTPGESASPPAQNTDVTEVADASGAAPVAADSTEGATQTATATPARGDDHVVTAILRETLHAPPLHLQDAYQRTDPSLPWTNFTLTFREVIDYIFFSSDSIEVLRTVPIPPESELTENFALPNKKYPSDHVALIADLAYKA